MQYISVQTASALTGRTERTFRRWATEGGRMRRGQIDSRGRATVALEDVLPDIGLVLEPGDVELFCLADAGDAEAQNDLALVFMSAGKHEAAVYLLQLAAAQEHADSMHWLGRCYIDGSGVQRDQALGISWLAKAAAKGHVISQAQLDGLVQGATSIRKR